MSFEEIMSQEANFIWSCTDDMQDGVGGLTSLNNIELISVHQSTIYKWFSHSL